MTQKQKDKAQVIFICLLIFPLLFVGILSVIQLAVSFVAFEWITFPYAMYRAVFVLGFVIGSCALVAGWEEFNED